MKGREKAVELVDVSNSIIIELFKSPFVAFFLFKGSFSIISVGSSVRNVRSFR